LELKISNLKKTGTKITPWSLRSVIRF